MLNVYNNKAIFLPSLCAMGKDSHQFWTIVTTVCSEDFSAKQSFMKD